MRARAQYVIPDLAQEVSTKLDARSFAVYYEVFVATGAFVTEETPVRP